jgi:hypothetical protein
MLANFNHGQTLANRTKPGPSLQLQTWVCIYILEFHTHLPRFNLNVTKGRKYLRQSKTVKHASLLHYSLNYGTKKVLYDRPQGWGQDGNFVMSVFSNVVILLR